MKTALRAADRSGVLEAARIIRNGGLAAFPTETVYGLGADAANETAVGKIYTVKGRPPDNPLILHICDVSQFYGCTEQTPDYCGALISAVWPGPLTVVALKKNSVPAWGTAGLPTIAIRMPSNETARLLIEYAQTPIYAPSANVSGRPSPTSARHVLQDLDGKIDIILDGGPCACGLESTVIDVSGDLPRVLRPGFITADMIYAKIGFYPETEHPLGKPKSPGMKYAHYAPKAELTVINGSPERAAALINERAGVEEKRVGILATDQTIDMYDKSKYFVLNAGDRSNAELIGANLFAALRAFDDKGVDIIYAEGIADAGVGSAVMDRLKKAAGGRVIEV
ncbi:MAG: threonylcarbamoyl-AMP synthase [Clostridiales bacterium]|jgi:L-threonylcarbamoyladenylate synthase|nr:threonylcarbamoyl-AMP synthase [Clostridiales bacterium]